MSNIEKNNIKANINLDSDFFIRSTPENQIHINQKILIKQLKKLTMINYLIFIVVNLIE